MRQQAAGRQWPDFVEIIKLKQGIKVSTYPGQIYPPLIYLYSEKIEVNTTLLIVTEYLWDDGV